MSTVTPPLGRRARESARAGKVRDSSPTMARSIAIVCRNLLREPSSLLSIGRFELVRTLGRGGHGVVYEAFDPLRREPVALKVLYERGPSYLYRLKREFRSLAELRHPNLVTLHELSVGPDDAHFTMELVGGCDLLAYVQDAALNANDALARTRAALAQLCEGVQALHRAGKLHRDLKPSNVQVDDSGRVVLFDFGLVDDASASSLNTGAGAASEPEGTRAYMAPEQARGAACEASDWYSFGKVLEQALDLLAELQPAGNTSTREQQERAALEQLAKRLTADDPEQRPGFAEIVALVHQRSRTLPPLPLASGAGRCERRFVARRAELSALADAFERSRRQPVVVLVRGETGLGKSALLRAFAAMLASPAAESGAAGARPKRVPAGLNACVLHGRCHEREALPYKALDSSIDELTRVLLALPDEHPARALAVDRTALLAMFPVLGRVPWLQPDRPSVGETNPVELRERGFAALRTLLRELAAERPLVLCIDDLQWSDADSGRLLGALLCEEDSPRVLIVATDRGDARLVNPAIEELQRVAELSPRPLCVEELALSPLDHAESVSLARAVLARTPVVNVAELESIAREARGNPRVLCELARWIGEGAQGDQLTVEQRSLDALLARRLGELNPASARMLALVAAAGRPLPTRVIAAAAELGIERHAHVKGLRAAGLLRAVLRAGDEWLELEHERIGEAVLQRIGPAERTALHATLVRALHDEPGALDEALIDQYLGAGMPHEAGRCAERAAETAALAFAFARAARLCEQALSLGEWSRDEQAKLEHAHAVALEHSGRGLDAAAAYERAAELTSDPLAVAQLEQQAADHLMRNGRARAGEALLARGYRALGLHWPERRLGLLLGIARQLLPRWLRRRQTADVQLQRLRAEFLARAGRGIENYDILRALYNALLCFDHAERSGDPVWLARAKGARGMLRCFGFWPGSFARGLAELEETSRIAVQLGDASAAGDLQNQLSVVHYFSGRPRAALEIARRSEAQLRSLPQASIDLYAVLGIIGAALLELGRVREARRTWNALTHASRLHGDLMTMVWVHAQPAQIAVLIAGEERARSQAILERVGRLRAEHPRYEMIAWVHAAGSLEHALYWGQPADAERIARQEQRALFGPRNGPLRVKARLVRARACVHAASALPPGREREALLRTAARDAARLRRARGASDQGVAWLLTAAIDALRDRRDRAIANLDRAHAIFQTSEASLLMAVTRYCQGALLGAEAGEALQAPALAAFEAEGVADPRRYIAWIACGFRGMVCDR